jgi:hypothetical protein
MQYIKYPEEVRAQNIKHKLVKIKNCELWGALNRTASYFEANNQKTQLTSKALDSLLDISVHKIDGTKCKQVIDNMMLRE